MCEDVLPQLSIKCIWHNPLKKTHLPGGEDTVSEELQAWDDQEQRNNECCAQGAAQPHAD